MRLKILIAVYIIVALVCGKILLNYFYNENVISAYEEGNYSVNDDLLTQLNIFEPYIAYYNNGNILYRLGQYEAAVEQYQNAIDSKIPMYDECPVRINMALSVIGQLDKNYKDAEHREESLEILYRARDILLEDECAKENGKGHSKKAERLKRDIEAAIEELEKLNEQQQQQQLQQQDQQLQRQMQQYQQQSMRDRQDDLNEYSVSRYNFRYENIW